jgi:acetyl esterase/lipase
MQTLTAFLLLSSVTSFTPSSYDRRAQSTTSHNIDLQRLQVTHPHSRIGIHVACSAQYNRQASSLSHAHELGNQFLDIPGATLSDKRHSLVDRTRHKILNFQLRKNVYTSFDRLELTPESILALRDKARRKLLSKVPPGVSISPTIIGNIQAEWVTPTNSKDLLPKVGLYFFGGAYLTGNPAYFRSITGNIARLAHMKILASNYRKLPENSYPAALEDAISAFDYLLSQGNHPQDIVIMGDSSGGHLALSLTLKLKEMYPDQRLAGLVLISPWTDMTMQSATLKSKRKTDPILPAHRMSELIDLIAGDMERNDPLISPLWADLSGLPPLLIHAGENEILLEDSTRLALHAHAAKVPTEIKIWSAMPHVFHRLHDFLPESREALAEVAHFIKQRA